MMAVKIPEKEKNCFTFASIQQVTELKTLNTKKATVKMMHDNLSSCFSN